MYRIGSPLVRNDTPGVLARQIAARPEPGRDGLKLFHVGRLGHHDDEGRQVLVERAQPVRNPGTQAGPAGDLVARLGEGDGRLVVDGVGIHAADEAHFVDHLGRVRQQLADPHAALAVPGELVLRRRDGEPRLAAGHGRQPLALADRVGQVLVVPGVHLRLVVVEIHLRRAADHVQIDDVLGLAGEVRAGQVRTGRGGGSAAESMLPPVRPKSETAAAPPSVRTVRSRKSRREGAVWSIA